MAKFLRVALAVLAAAASALAQHVITLSNGAQMHGLYDGGGTDTVRFIDDRGNRHTWNVSEVRNIVFNGPLLPGTTTFNGPPAAPPPPQPGGPPYTGYPAGAPAPMNSQPGYPDSDEQPAAGWTQAGVIPAGTEIVVRTIDPIEARWADADQHYLAEVEHNVIDASGRVVIPQRSKAHLVVRDVGGGQIAIDLRSVHVDGKRYILNSQNITKSGQQDGLGMNKRTGGFLGGGAVLGTVLGAVAGGGKGAAIGALVGGAAGAGAAALTRGKELHVPPETVMRFRLDQPVYLYR